MDTGGLAKGEDGGATGELVQVRGEAAWDQPAAVEPGEERGLNDLLLSVLSKTGPPHKMYPETTYKADFLIF